MVTTLHPHVATITPQYAVPFTLNCAAGRPALVEQTAAVLVILFHLIVYTNSLLFIHVFLCFPLLMVERFRRAWKHVLHLVAVSLQHSERLVLNVFLSILFPFSK